MGSTKTWDGDGEGDFKAPLRSTGAYIRAKVGLFLKLVPHRCFRVIDSHAHPRMIWVSQ